MRAKAKYPVVSLNDVSEKIDYGFTASATEIGNGPKFLRITDIQNDQVDWSTVPLCEASEQDKNKFALAEGDIVFARTGATTGKSYLIYKCPEQAIFASYLIRVRPSDKIYSSYLSRFFQTPNYWSQINLSTSGTAQGGVNATKLKALQIPLPPLAEQRRIAAILDKADAIRRKRKQAIQYTEELLSATFLDMFGEPSNIELIDLEKLASEKKHALSSGPFGSNLTSSHYVDEGVLVLRGKNVTGGKLDLTDVKYVSEEKAQELARSSVKPGDVVVVAVGASGAALAVPDYCPQAVMSQNFNKITPDSSKVESVYLTYAINSTFVQNQLAQNITDTVRTFLSLTKLRKIQIPVPDINLQRQFVDFVKSVDASQKRFEATFNESEDLFNSLLQRAFRGDL